MTRNEVKGLLEMLRLAYPNTYKQMNSVEMSKQIDFYLGFFKDEPGDIMRIAVEHYIEHNKYSPTIAGLKEAAARLKAGSDVDELWKEAWNAICGNKKFEALSAANKRYFGSQAMIDNLGQSEDTVQSVIKGQYMKRISEILENEEIKDSAIKALGIDRILQIGGNNEC